MLNSQTCEFYHAAVDKCRGRVCLKDDYRISLRYEIITKDMEPLCPVDMSGRFTDPVSDFKGQYVKVCSPCTVISLPAGALAKYCDDHVSRVLFAKFYVHVAYGRGSVLILRDDEIQRGRGNFGGFPSH